MVLNFRINNFLIIGFFISYILCGVFFQVLNLTSYSLTLVPMFFLILSLLIINVKKIRINLNYLKVIFLIFLAIYFETLFSTIIYGNFKLERALGSLYFLFVILFVSPIIVYFIYLKEVLVSRIFIIIYIFLSFMSYFAYFLNIKGILHGKNMLIFPEPSHLALILIPILLFINTLINNTKIQILNNINILILSFLIKNATLLLGSIFAFILISKRRHFVVLILFMLLFLLINLDVDKTAYTYFTSRLTLNTESDISHLSSLVYLSGFERAYMTLTDSNLIGVGFNRMGYVGPTGNYQDQLYKLGYPDLNLYDGGATAFKLITELGAFGVILIILYMYGFLKVFVNLNKFQTITSKLFASYYLSFSFELFIRGVGYFSPNFILFLGSVYYLFFIRQKYKYTYNYS